MRNLSGSISIYFTFCIVLIISIVLSVTEIARMTAQRLYLQIVTNSSLDSMASLFHRDLYEYYCLFGVEYRTNDLLTKEYLSYIEPYFRDSDTGRVVNNWYISEIDEDNINLSNRLLTDNTYLEKEIINYEKLSLLGRTISFLGKDIDINNENDIGKLLTESEKLIDDEGKSKLYSEIYIKYFDFASDIEELENYGRNIKDYIDRTNLKLNYCRSVSSGGSLSNGRAVLTKISDVKSQLSSLKSNLGSFKSKMGDFRRVVNEKRDVFNEDRIDGNYEFTDEIISFIEEEFEQFLQFVDENSDMNREVDGKIVEVDRVYQVTNGYYSNLNSCVSALASVEDSLAYERSKHGDERDSDYIKELNDERKDLQDELKDCIDEIREEIRDVHISGINLPISITNHTREKNILIGLAKKCNGILLNAVLDQETINKIEIGEKLINSFNILSNNNTVSIDKLLMGEYELDKFNYYNKNLNDENTASGSENLEVERLISGKFSDKDNLNEVINRILLIRIGLNVLHIYKDSTKRQTARTFAYVTFAGFSRLLAETMFLLIITAWGTAQSLVDVKRLLKNVRVNFMHDDISWTVSIDSLLSIASGGNLEASQDDDTGISLTYKDYLRLLLINERQSDINARICGIVESNIKLIQENFDFEKLIYAFYVENTYICKHYFTNLLFLQSKDGRLYDEYYIKNTGYREFYN